MRTFTRGWVAALTSHHPRDKTAAGRPVRFGGRRDGRGGEGKRENKCEAHALARFQHSGRASLADNPLKNNRTKQLSANIVPAAAALAPAGPAAPPKISLPTTVSVGPFLNIPKAGDLKPISV